MTSAAGAIDHGLASLRRVADIPDDVAQQMRERKPISVAERQMAAQERRRLMADPQWVKTWLSGNRAARSRLAIVDFLLSLPVVDVAPSRQGAGST
jgi:hypothetical protein